jgi:hypothetical protein
VLLGGQPPCVDVPVDRGHETVLVQGAGAVDEVIDRIGRHQLLRVEPAAQVERVRCLFPWRMTSWAKAIAVLAMEKPGRPIEAPSGISATASLRLTIFFCMQGPPFLAGMTDHPPVDRDPGQR